MATENPIFKRGSSVRKGRREENDEGTEEKRTGGGQTIDRMTGDLQ